MEEDLVPKVRRSRNHNEVGKEDSCGFFRTPNGSFWDMDGEYFNRHGFDIHGGCYKDRVDYIPGKDWIEDLGCYPDEKEKYMMEDNFEDDIDDELQEKLDELNMCDNDENIDKDINKDINDKKDSKKNKDKKNKKKKKVDKDDDDEWEEIED